jgi:hypothetical protein
MWALTQLLTRTTARGKTGISTTADTCVPRTHKREYGRQRCIEVHTSVRLRAFCRLQRLVGTGTTLFLVVSRGGDDFLFVWNSRDLRAVGQDGIQS